MIDLKDVYKIYEVGDTIVRALDGISLHIDEGEFVAIVGQSGSRKIHLYEHDRVFGYSDSWKVYARWYRC